MPSFISCTYFCAYIALVISSVVAYQGAFSSSRQSRKLTLTPDLESNMKDFRNYLSRIGISSSKSEQILQKSATKDSDTLSLIMESQSRSIPFENLDVVLHETVSMSPSDVERKLVNDRRGGYCWEQNTLLRIVLEEIGYDVVPFACRVRWGKKEGKEEPNMTFTHLALKVIADDGTPWLADVGFGGVNSLRPINLGVGEKPQELPEGQYRVVPSKFKDFHVLQLSVKGTWRPLYEWRDERVPLVDQESMNWYSCTYPKARFTNQLFISIVKGEKGERSYILNDEYVVQKGQGAEREVLKERIKDKERLLELIDTVFGVKLEKTEGIDRYLKLD